VYIYKTTNKLNGRIYVGQSKFNPSDNPEYLGSGYILRKAIAHYGRGNFLKEVIEECSTREQLCERERYWIATLKATDRVLGYNICEGGQFGDTWTANPRKEELRQLFRDISKGPKNGNFGHKWSAEQKHAASLRATARKAWLDPITGVNFAQHPDTRKKIAASKLGDKNPQAYGWELTSPSGLVTVFSGGVKPELKKQGLTYSQFTCHAALADGTRLNGRGWQLKKLVKVK